MKKLLLSIIGLLLASAIGCSNSADTSNKSLIGLAALTGTGQVSFSFDEASTGAAKSIAGSTNAPGVTALVVTITDASNNTVYNAVSLPVTSLNGQYITQPLTLAAGSYHLTSFAAVNSSGTALYASPLEGSALVYLVNDPLPIDFTVTKNQVSKLVPEVLSTATYTAGDFGYATFNFDIVETIDFLAGVIAYNETSSNYELTNATITVTSGSTTLYSGTLPAAVTALKVRDGYTSYTMTITKTGYADYTHTFTNAELKAYMATPLTVTLIAGNVPEIHTVITTEYNASDNSIANETYSYNNSDQYQNYSKDDYSLTSFTIGLGFPSGRIFQSLTEFYASVSPGANGTWLDMDDTLAYRYVFNSSDNHFEFYTSMDPSSLANYSIMSLNQDGYLTGMTSYSAGPDGLFYTADDVAGTPTTLTLDAQNRASYITNGSYQQYGIEYNGDLIIKIICYNNSGTTIYNVKTIQYDVNNHPISMNFYSDNEITQMGRATIEYNASGRFSKIVYYNSAGTDGIWGNSDDVIGVFNTGANYSGFAYGHPFLVGGHSTALPVATFEYDQYGISTRTNGFSDNGTTLVRYSTMEYY